MLGLPPEKKLLLFGAMSSTSDPRKGYHLLIPALQKLKSEGKADNLELIIFGASHGEAEEETGIITHYMGRLNDDFSLCLLYNSANIFIAPSLQDNLPNTVVESLSCGTPCITFDIGGMKDLLCDPMLGTKCQSIDFNCLAEVVKKEISREEKKDMISGFSLKKHSQKKIAEAYRKTYHLLL
ncbi:hypothetical protein GCM10023116_08830 [Kistimonas scapharcae]|uniref:Glycosyl transferase family 1 domain-containing protein n=1 Tax=Kistimonas scapharcae TaxID=1036133 RepID=A0ABP8UZM3_9GAMM